MSSEASSASNANTTSSRRMAAPAGARRSDTYRPLTESRGRLNSAIDGLPPDKMLVPLLNDWSVKDILTHITSWDELLLPDIYRLPRGRAAPGGAAPAALPATSRTPTTEGPTCR